MAIYQFPQSEPNFIESWTLNLEAGRVKVLEAYGRSFVCIFAQGAFDMSFNNGKYFKMFQGAKWILQENERYNTLKLLSATNQSVTVITGNFFYDQTSVTTVVQTAKTRTFPGPTSIAAGAVVTLNTIPAGVTYRKAVIVTNNDPDVDLEIYAQDAAAAWQLAGTVFHLQAWYLETSDALRVKNPAGS